MFLGEEEISVYAVYPNSEMTSNTNTTIPAIMALDIPVLPIFLAAIVSLSFSCLLVDTEKNYRLHPDPPGMFWSLNPNSTSFLSN